MVIPEQGRAAGRYHLILNTLPMKKNSTDAITRVSKPPMMTSRHRALLVFIAEILCTRRVQSAGLSPKLSGRSTRHRAVQDSVKNLRVCRHPADGVVRLATRSRDEPCCGPVARQTSEGRQCPPLR